MDEAARLIVPDRTMPTAKWSGRPVPWVEMLQRTGRRSGQPVATAHTIVGVIPPSTRRAAPLVAADKGLAR